MNDSDGSDSDRTISGVTIVPLFKVTDIPDFSNLKWRRGSHPKLTAALGSSMPNFYEGIPTYEQTGPSFSSIEIAFTG